MSTYSWFGPIHPPLTRWCQVQAALVAGLAGSAWGAWQMVHSQDLPKSWWMLPLPKHSSLYLTQSLQAWREQMPLSPSKLTVPDYSDGTDLLDLLLWGLRATDGAWNLYGHATPGPESRPGQAPGAEFGRLYLEKLYQALFAPTQSAWPGPNLGHWHYYSQQSTEPLAQATKQLSPEQQGLAWGSLYGACWGLEHLPALWIAHLSPELTPLTQHLIGAWAGSQIPILEVNHPAITAAGHLNPR